MIFVTHDLGVLRAVADRALVLESGHVREAGGVAQLLESPRNAYTATLVRSIPDPAAHYADQHQDEQHRGGSDETRVPR
jgi:ABC-type glutathione transport system ATPase component